MNAEVNTPAGDNQVPVIAFVCTGNLCRSVFAQCYAEDKVSPDAAQFISAGLHAREGTPMDPQMAQRLVRLGIDPGHRFSSQVEDPFIDQADLVLTMEASQRSKIIEIWPKAIRKTYGLGQFVSILESMPAKASALEAIKAAFAVRRPATPEQDIADPFQRGEKSYDRAATEVAAMVDRLLAGLGLTEAS